MRKTVVKKLKAELAKTSPKGIITRQAFQATKRFYVKTAGKGHEAPDTSVKFRPTYTVTRLEGTPLAYKVRI